MYQNDVFLAGKTAVDAYKPLIGVIRGWLQSQCAQTNDFALVSAPTGSGKSSCLAGLREALQEDNKYIVLAPFVATWAQPHVNALARLVAHLEGDHQGPAAGAVRSLGTAPPELWNEIADYSDTPGLKRVNEGLASSPDNFRERVSRQEKAGAKSPTQIRGFIHSWLDKVGVACLKGQSAKPQFVLCIDDLDFVQADAWDLLNALQYLRHPLLSVIVFADLSLLQQAAKNGILRDNVHMTAHGANSLAQESLRRWFPARFELPVLTPEQRRSTLEAWGMPPGFWDLWQNESNRSVGSILSAFLPANYRQLKQVHNWTMHEIVPLSPADQADDKQLWQLRRSFIARVLDVQFAPLVDSAAVQALFAGRIVADQRVANMVAAMTLQMSPAQLVCLSDQLDRLTVLTNYLRH